MAVNANQEPKALAATRNALAVNPSLASLVDEVAVGIEPLELKRSAGREISVQEPDIIPPQAEAIASQKQRCRAMGQPASSAAACLAWRATAVGPACTRAARASASATRTAARASPSLTSTPARETAQGVPDRGGPRNVRGEASGAAVQPRSSSASSGRPPCFKGNESSSGVSRSRIRITGAA